jgi:hypothetical protein
MKLFLICSSLLFISVCFADTNNINYIGLQYKELAQEKLENLYGLKVSKSILLSGENIIDYNTFSNINRIKTYTTIKINF